jgi:hypothetical protein
MENEIQTITQTDTQAEIRTTHCLNCGTDFEGKFCPECGQNAETGRFTMRFIYENLLAAFISKDGGIWFTLKNLFTRPGEMIVEILNGKRRRYFSPFPMLFFVLTVYILLISITGSRSTFRRAEETYNARVEESFREEMNEQNKGYKKETERALKLISTGYRIYNNHYTLVYMLTLPLYLLSARLCYGKNNRKRYYRAEYLVAIAYSSVIVIIYRWLVSLTYLISNGFSNRMGSFMPIATAIALFVCLRKMMGFSIAKTAWRSLLTVVLYYVFLVFIVFVALLIGVVVLIILANDE